MLSKKNSRSIKMRKQHLLFHKCHWVSLLMSMTIISKGQYSSAYTLSKINIMGAALLAFLHLFPITLLCNATKVSFTKAHRPSLPQIKGKNIFQSTWGFWWSMKRRLTVSSTTWHKKPLFANMSFLWMSSNISAFPHNASHTKNAALNLVLPHFLLASVIETFNCEVYILTPKLTNWPHMIHPKSLHLVRQK